MKDDSSNNNKAKDIFNINMDLDLYKISFKTLKDSKLSDFKGKLIHHLLNELLDNSENININNIKYVNEKESNNNNNIMNKSASYNSKYKNNNKLKYINDFNMFRIDKIIFQIKYDTKLGEDLAIIGSINELGNWNPYHSLKMGWNEGNIWKTELYINDKTILDFEYKFIVTSGGFVKRWEEGYNRKFNFSCFNIYFIYHLIHQKYFLCIF